MKLLFSTYRHYGGLTSVDISPETDERRNGSNAAGFYFTNSVLRTTIHWKCFQNKGRGWETKNEMN
jgi:hypothetical protein